MTTDPHGSYVVQVPKSVLIKRYLEGGDWLNIELDIYSPVGSTSWDTSLRRRGDSTTALRFVVDLGKKTVTLNGHTSKAQVF